MPALVVFGDDLLFGSSVAGEAQAAGLTVAHARTLTAVQALAPSAWVAADLALPGLDLAALVGWAHRQAPPVRVLAYGPHVGASALAAARAAGCDAVLPRSAVKGWNWS